MNFLSQDSKREIKDRMAGLSGKQARRTARELASAFGVGLGIIYQESREMRLIRARATKGERKIQVKDEILEKMLSLTQQTDCAATDVVRIFERNGLIETDMVRPTWFSRWLKGQRMSRKELKRDYRPYRRFEASEPGEVYQIDATLAEQFYVDDDGSIVWESRASRNKNRKGNQKTRLVLMAAIDDCSRAHYAEFTTGQTVNHWLNFEFNAFRVKEDPRFIFHGIPACIYMDHDAVTKNPKFVRAHNALGIKVKKHKPTRKNDRFSNARSKGKIERLLRALAERQKITKIKKFASLAEANRFLLEVCLELNLRKHSSTRETPFARWNRIRPEMLIQCSDNELFESFYRDIFERLVYRDCTIRLNGETWQMPFERPFLDMINQRVTLYQHPIKQDRIFIEWDGSEYEVERRGAEMRAWADGPVHLPKSEREERLERAANEDLSGLKLWGFDQGPQEGVIYLPPKEGVPLDTSRIRPEPLRISRVDAMRRIARELRRPLTAGENSLLREALPDQATEDEITLAIESLLRPAEARTG